MTRSRASAKQAGAKFERLIADYLAATVDDRIDRRVTTGARDTGDIGGVRSRDGHRITIETKDYGGRVEIGAWLGEVERERVNDRAAIGLVVAKRRGKSDPADQLVLMTLADLAVLLTGIDRLAPP